MPECPEFVIWNVRPGSKFCAQSSASDGNSPSNDYDAGVHIVQPGGSAIDWAKSDLDPRPACLAPLVEGGYGASARLLSGPSGPTATLHVWIEVPGGSKPFDCTWTNAEAGTEFHIAIVIVVKP